MDKVKISNVFSHCKSSADIISILEKNRENMNDSSIYIKAITICNRLKKDDPRPIHRIFTMLLNSNIKPNVFEFNKFFDCILDSPLLCARYFKAMTNKYQLIPDIVTFSILIKGCKTQSRYRTAGKYWYLMKEKYNITPNNTIYKEMIDVYSKAHKIDRAQKIFDEYLQRINNKQLNIHSNTFKAYLKVFSGIGDIKGMKRVFKMMQHYKIDIDSSIIGNIMNGYLIAGHPEKSIKSFNKYIDSKGSMNEMSVLLDKKCKALNEMIQLTENDNFDKKYELYTELCHTIDHEFNEYGVSVHEKHIQYKLEGAISVYIDNNAMKIVEIFESLIKENKIKYMKYYEDMDIFGIDLHEFRFLSAKFVLSYCIAFKLKELLSTNDYLMIVVGQGLHAEGKKNKKGKLAEFIINELLSYQPSIKCKYDTNNRGRLIVEKSELMPYLNEQQNHAKRKLINNQHDA